MSDQLDGAISRLTQHVRAVRERHSAAMIERETQHRRLVSEWKQAIDFVARPFFQRLNAAPFAEPDGGFSPLSAVSAAPHRFAVLSDCVAPTATYLCARIRLHEGSLERFALEVTVAPSGTLSRSGMAEIGLGPADLTESNLIEWFSEWVDHLTSEGASNG